MEVCLMYLMVGWGLCDIMCELRLSEKSTNGFQR